MAGSEKQRVRLLTVLALLSTLLQFVLTDVAWLIQAGWVSVIICGIAAVLFIVTWGIPWLVRQVQETRRQDATLREKQSDLKADSDLV